MTVYFTSDLHIGHEKVADVRMQSLEAHDDLVAVALCQGITKRDQVWILGDISAGGRRAEENALEFIARAKSYTRAEYHLIPGNHDSCHPQFDRGYRRLPRFLEVFDSVQPFTWRKIAGHRVLLSHYPYSADHTAEPRHMQWRLPDMGKWLLHGHTHQQVATVGTREICVGLDAWDYWPVTLEQIADLISTAAYPKAV
ncbi:metallophosphoesterase [Gordonia phage Squiddly]|nr:metallophosphoesterase [Gordonia phage Squiddly]UYL87872.1 metallophosphoesterase [Gordonia phage Malisha]